MVSVLRLCYIRYGLTSYCIKLCPFGKLLRICQGSCVNWSERFLLDSLEEGATLRKLVIRNKPVGL